MPFRKPDQGRIFFEGDFIVGLHFVPLVFERLNFQMGRLRKELVNELGVTILKSCEIRIYLIYQKIKKM